MAWTHKFGPFHDLPGGVYGLDLSLNGYSISQAKAQFGFSSRSIVERLSEKSWRKNLFLPAHLSPEVAPICEILFSESVEAVFVLAPPKRAQVVRRIIATLAETSRILRVFGQYFSAVELQPALHFTSRMREEMLDLLELMTGSRYGYYFVRPGGIRWDISEGFIFRLDDWAHKFENDLFLIKDYVAMTNELEIIPKEKGRVTNWKADFTSIESSVSDRLRYFVDALEEVAEDILVGISQMPAGAYAATIDAKSVAQVAGDFDCRWAGVRGLWRWTGSLTKDGKFKGLQIRTPSEGSDIWIQEALRGAMIEEVPIILSTLDFIAVEVDQ